MVLPEISDVKSQRFFVFMEPMLGLSTEGDIEIDEVSYLPSFVRGPIDVSNDAGLIEGCKLEVIIFLQKWGIGSYGLLQYQPEHRRLVFSWCR